MLVPNTVLLPTQCCSAHVLVCKQVGALLVGVGPNKVSLYRDGTAQLQSELQSLAQQEGVMRKQLESKEKRLQDVEASIQELQAKIEEVQTELGTELHNHLSATERQELAQLTPRLKQLQASIHYHSTIRMALLVALKYIKVLSAPSQEPCVRIVSFRRTVCVLNQHKLLHHQSWGLTHRPHVGGLHHDGNQPLLLETCSLT